MLNNWTVIRYSGMPWHNEKWTSAQDVLVSLYDELQHAGGNHDHAKILMHNSKIVVADRLKDIAWKYGDFAREQYDLSFAKIKEKVAELIPPEIEEKSND